MNPDLSRLRTLAKAATEGPWFKRVRHESDRGDSFGVDYEQEYSHQRLPVIPTLNIPEADAEYIAAASPDVVLKLLDMIGTRS